MTPALSLHLEPTSEPEAQAPTHPAAADLSTGSGRSPCRAAAKASLARRFTVGAW